MPRYVIVDKGLGLAGIETQARSAGATGLKLAPKAKQLFCELAPAAAQRLNQVPGLIVRPVRKTTLRQLPAAPERIVYSSLQASLSSTLWDFRNAFIPPVTGAGFTCAVLDTGVRSTHVALSDKVVYEENFTDSPDCSDVFNHGTAVAYLIAGGEHGPGLECGAAPGVKIMNLKCIGDDGIGTEEWLILALERARDLFDAAEADPTMVWDDDLYLNMVNVSAGAEDIGDPDDPIRLAVEELYGTSPYGPPLYCAAGNMGPDEGTIDLPAAARHAWAVGAVTFSPFQAWEFSARGPSKADALTKPEMVTYGVSILAASSASDEAYVVKTGTSFASPLALGQLCLFCEAMARAGYYEVPFSMLSYEQLEQLALVTCIKPSGSLMTKDNTYGYGMPYGDLMMRQLPEVPQEPSGIAGVVGVVAPVMVLGMMVPMMRQV